MEMNKEAPLLPEKVDVLIIGGGIVGVCIAYFLAKKGTGEICLLERTQLGYGSTGKCAGGIRVNFSTEINVRLSLLSMELIRDLQEITGIDPEFKEVGYLLLATSRSHWEVMAKSERLLLNLGQKAYLMSRGEIREKWPFLRVGDVVGGIYTPRDGYAGPHEVLYGFVKAARALGVNILEGVEVTGFRMSGGVLKAVKTSLGKDIRTSLVINAAGPWAADVAKWADVDIPVRPYRRQLFFTSPFQEGIPLKIPVIIELPKGWYMRREGAGLLLSGPQDRYPSFNEDVDFEGKLWCSKQSIKRVPALKRADIMRGWAGLYAVSPDHHAILGSFPERPQMVFANGFSGHGFQHAPAVGQLIAEIISVGRALSLDIHPLRPQRFREGDLIHEPLTALGAGKGLAGHWGD
jgi:sarcosine oxidase subunit beta